MNIVSACQRSKNYSLVIMRTPWRSRYLRFPCLFSPETNFVLHLELLGKLLMLSIVYLRDLKRIDIKELDLRICSSDHQNRNVGYVDIFIPIRCFLFPRTAKTVAITKSLQSAINNHDR